MSGKPFCAVLGRRVPVGPALIELRKGFRGQDTTYCPMLESLLQVGLDRRSSTICCPWGAVGTFPAVNLLVGLFDPPLYDHCRQDFT